MIKDYTALINRGSIYAKRSGWIWSKRRLKLLRLFPYQQIFENQIRIKKIIYGLEARLHHLGVILDFEAKQIERRKESDARLLVLMECSDFFCRHSDDPWRVAIPFSVFEPDKATCKICGAVLQLMENGEIETLFLELNLKTI